MSVKRYVKLTQNMLYLAETAQTGKISKAAEKNGIKSSNLSKIIHEVEKALGFDIFDRKYNGISVTPQASRIMDKAQELLDFVRELEAEIETQIKENGGQVLRVYKCDELNIKGLDSGMKSNGRKFIRFVYNDKDADFSILNRRPKDATGKIVIKKTIGGAISQDVYIVYDGANPAATELYNFLVMSVR